jgi:hypothetical protein
LSGGSVPTTDSLVLCLVELNAILGVDARNLTLRAQSGVITQRIDEAAGTVVTRRHFDTQFVASHLGRPPELDRHLRRERGKIIARDKRDVGAERGTQRGRRLAGDQTSAMQNRDAIAAFGLVKQMGGYNNSHSGCGAQLVESKAQARTCRRIEPRRRLVEEQNARTRQQALGNFHAPLQTSGQSLHAVIETVCHAQRLQRRKQTLLQFRAAQPVKVARTAEVFRDGQLRIERRRLEDNTEMLAHLDGFMHHIVAADARRAGGWGQQRGQNPEERRLTTAIGSEQAEHFAVTDG